MWQSKVLQWIAAFLNGRHQRVIVNGSKSSWSPITSGIPQGMYSAQSSLYATSTTCQRWWTHLFTCLPMTPKSANTSPFNEEKCKVMHLGRNNHKYKYVIASSGTNTTLGETTNERDLGVQVDPELKFYQHVELIANKANTMLGLIRRSFTFLDGPTVKKLYSSLVRPILKYGNVIWAPTLKRDQRILENVQQRTTKLIPELKCQENCDRLKVLKLPSLYYRRARGDMIEVYNYLHGVYKVDEMPL